MFRKINALWPNIAEGLFPSHCAYDGEGVSSCSYLCCLWHKSGQNVELKSPITPDLQHLLFGLLFLLSRYPHTELFNCQIQHSFTTWSTAKLCFFWLVWPANQTWRGYACGEVEGRADADRAASKRSPGFKMDQEDQPLHLKACRNLVNGSTKTLNKNRFTSEFCLR